jgi:hypothetical protein
MRDRAQGKVIHSVENKEIVVMRVFALVLIISLCTSFNTQAESKEAKDIYDDIYLKTLMNLQQVDVSTYTEVDIHAPAKVVWKYLADMREAQKYSPADYHLETGAWTEIGSVVEAHHKGKPFPQFRQKVIDSIPYKYFVFRMSSKISEDAVERFDGYDVYVLLESNSITKVIFIQPLTFGNLNLTKEELTAFREGQRKFIRPIFEGLKQLVESEYKP